MIADAVDFPIPTTGEVSDSGELDIIAALQIAPRIPAKALSEILNLAPTSVTRKLNRLQNERLVRVIGRFAWPLVLSGNPMQMWIRCQPGRAYEVAERLKQIRDIQFLMVTSGSADIYADVYPLLGTDGNDLIGRKIPSISGIVSSQTQLVLKTSRVGQSWRLDRLNTEQQLALTDFADPVTDPGFTNIQQLSELEFKTMCELGKNARISAAEVGRKLSVSASSAYRTIQTLLSTGAISPRVEIEPAAVGFPLNATVSLQADPSAIPRILAELSDHPSARMVSMVAGKASVIHTGVFRSPSDLSRFITNDIGALQGVLSIDTCVGMTVMRRYWMDRDGVRINDQIEGLLTR